MGARTIIGLRILNLWVTGSTRVSTSEYNTTVDVEREGTGFECAWPHKLHIQV